MTAEKNAFGYVPDRKVVDVVKEKPFILSAEIVPPRNGANHEKVITQVKSLIGSGAEVLSVTKGAGGSLRGGSLPIVHLVKEKLGLPCIAHFTCRDITPQEVENQLIDHHYFGIRNILALRGDPPHGQPDWEAREGSHNYAYQLIEQIQKLNQGGFLERPGRQATGQSEETDFCIGAAAYPEHPHGDVGTKFFKQKVEAGAEFGITQMLFDTENYARFLDTLEKLGVDIPIFPGTRVVRTKAQVEKMCQLFNVKIPKESYEKLPTEKTPESYDQVIEIFLDVAKRFKELGAPGIHLFVLSDSKLPGEFFRRLEKEVNSAI